MTRIGDGFDNAIAIFPILLRAFCAIVVITVILIFVISTIQDCVVRRRKFVNRNRDERAMHRVTEKVVSEEKRSNTMKLSESLSLPSNDSACDKSCSDEYGSESAIKSFNESITPADKAIVSIESAIAPHRRV